MAEQTIQRKSKHNLNSDASFFRFERVRAQEKVDRESESEREKSERNTFMNLHLVLIGEKTPSQKLAFTENQKV